LEQLSKSILSFVDAVLEEEEEEASAVSTNPPLGKKI